ncbi:MAG TPA: hypothetical protein VMA77_17450 [Solirubrobacteraceae bacterium]|nr:hypothetical protein [Solirubrobacteraceae bacterium]
MTHRERIARALLRTYPAHTRASLGAEMAGTVLDSSDASHRMFARECSALVVAGVRARARGSASEKVLGQLVDGYVLAGQIWLGLLLSYGTAQLLRNPVQGLGGGLVFVLVLWPILGISLIGARRTGGTAATTWIVCLILIAAPTPLKVAVTWLLPLTSCLAMATCQQNGRRDLRRLVWLAPVAIMSLLPQSRELALGTAQIDGLILGSAVAVAIFPINPRLLVACAVVWTVIGLMSAVPDHGQQSVPLLALSAPLLLLATTSRLALARRRARL